MRISIGREVNQSQCFYILLHLPVFLQRNTTLTGTSQVLHSQGPGAQFSQLTANTSDSDALCVSFLPFQMGTHSVCVSRKAQLLKVLATNCDGLILIPGTLMGEQEPWLQ